MRLLPTINLLVLFGVVLSLVSLPSLTPGFLGPGMIPVARANLAPREAWYPAGPAMDTQVINIFQDQGVELAALQQAAPSIDLTDWRLTPAQLTSLSGDPRFLVTSQVTEQGYDEIEFNQANNYWGVNFNFGNDPNGVLIRQGIAHLIDRSNFAQNEVDIARSLPIDEPIPSGSSYGGSTFVAPNSCLWDTFKGTAAACTQAGGTPGGYAYNCVLTIAPCPTGILGAAAPNTWQAQIGSADFCAAATHIMNALNNGVLTGVHQNANCVLLAPGQSSTGIGWPMIVTSNAPNFFVREDDAPRLTLGDNYSQEICALFTGAYTTGCAGFLSVTHGTITSFGGFTTTPGINVCSSSGINLCWWMYTAAFSTFPIDAGAYFGYNSQFVSGGPWDHPACASNTSTPSARNYEYVCNTAYDAASKSVEFPADGTVATAFANAQTAANIFGQNVFTIPSYTQIDQNAYLSNWSRVINGASMGTPNFFTWLNAWSPTPATGPTGCPNTPPLSTGLCVRQGFSHPTRSLGPFIASTDQDLRFLSNVYDSLGVQNPSNLGQLMDWMTIRSQELGCISLKGVCDFSLGYNATAGTTDNFRFTLRSDLFWHDGHKVTSWDVQFSFASLLANGAFSGAGLSPLIPPSGSCNTTPPANGNCADQITVLASTQFDVHVYQHGPFTQLGLMTTPIIPGRHWSVNGTAAWDNCVLAGSCSARMMSADPSKLVITYDPIQPGILIGSGPWKCVSTGVSTPAGTLGSGCSSTGLQNPPPGGSYSLTRFGIGSPPGASVSNAYFRSSGTFALYIWSGNTGDQVGDVLNFSRLAACFGQPTVPLGQTSGCGHLQQGIGANGGPTVVGGIQASIVLRFLFQNWVSPFNLTTNLPTNMAVFPPVLYEGTATLIPASGAGCTSPYPTGGYDC